jgi:NAD(P)-dependent dehydrogenase (short-subunit alcohol dehydrogenase family)
MRRAKRGLLVWIGSSSVAGGVPPLLGPYFAAKAGMDALAVAYVRELAPLGIESAIVVPGAFTTGTNHFANAGEPQDKDRSSDYNQAWPNGFAERVRTALAATVPADADPAEVAHAVAAIIEAQLTKGDSVSSLIQQVTAPLFLTQSSTAFVSSFWTVSD